MKRRRVLAALGGTGVAAFAGLALTTDDSVRYTYASSHDCTDATLTAEWRETYTRDGQTTLLENTTASTDANRGTEDKDGTPEPAVIHLQNILPGDRGTVSFRITADSIENGNTVTPTLDFVLEETAENGVTDPEIEANDTTPNDGELQDHLDVKLWEDTGLLGFNVLGANNIDDDIGEPTIYPDDNQDEGTLQDAADKVNGDSLGNIGVGESVSIAFRWEFADDNDINVTQTDSVTFTFDIGCS